MFNLTKIYIYKVFIFTLIPHFLSFSKAFYLIFMICFGLFSHIERKSSKELLHSFDHLPSDEIAVFFEVKEIWVGIDDVSQKCQSRSKTNITNFFNRT